MDSDAPAALFQPLSVPAVGRHAGTVWGSTAFLVDVPWLAAASDL